MCERERERERERGYVLARVKLGFEMIASLPACLPLSIVVDTLFFRTSVNLSNSATVKLLMLSSFMNGGSSGYFSVNAKTKPRTGESRRKRK